MTTFIIIGICEILALAWGFAYGFWWLHSTTEGEKLYEDNINIATGVGLTVDFIIALLPVLYGVELSYFEAWAFLFSLVIISGVGSRVWHNGQQPVSKKGVEF